MKQRFGDLPYVLTESVERVGDWTFRLEVLDDFERTSARIAPHLRGSREAREDLSPMFGVLWGSARAMSEWLMSQGSLEGERILELACGLALPSLVAARLGAEVWATDQHPHTDALLQRNAATAGVSVSYCRYDWRREPPAALPARFDRVLVSDVLFAHEMPALAAKTLATWVRGSTVGVLADPGRAWLQEFIDAAEVEGLRTEVEVWEVQARERDRAQGADEVFLVSVRSADA